MIRKQIYLTAGLNERLNEIAQARGVPQAEVIREGLDTYLATEEKKSELWDEMLAKRESSGMKVASWRRDSLYAERTGTKGEGSGHGGRDAGDR